MNFTLLLNIFMLIVVLTVVIVLPITMIIALLVPKKDGARERRSTPDQQDQNRSGLRKTIFNMLVMRPWPYKDLYNPLSRNYWPDEQTKNRAGRRQRLHSRRKK